MRGRGIGDSFQWVVPLVVFVFSLCILVITGMKPPPNYSQSNMPDTNFTCDDKTTGGYYADPEASCQMFHVCVRISDDEINDFRFLCPHDTVFDQQNFICTNWWEIDCEKSTRFYSKNDLFRVKTEAPEEDYVAPVQSEDTYYEYIYEYSDVQTPSPQIDHFRHHSQGRSNLGKTQTGKLSRSTAIETPYAQTLIPNNLFSTTTTKPSTVSSTTTVETNAGVVQTSNQVSKLHFQRVTFFPTREDKSSLRVSTPATKFFSKSRLNIEANSNGATWLENESSSSVPLLTRGNGTFLSRLRKEQQNQERESRKLNSGIIDDSLANYGLSGQASPVTSNARTRYETLFGFKSSRGREFSDPHKKQNIELRNRVNIKPSINPKSSSKTSRVDSTKVSFPPKIKTSSRHRTQQLSSDTKSSDSSSSKLSNRSPNTEDNQTKQKLMEFSNFRFYKTAFGRTYSSNDYFRKTNSSSTSTTPSLVKLTKSARPERTASRNTRYSIYG